MGNFLSTRLFRVGETQVTVSSLLLAAAIIAGSLLVSRLARNFVADRLLGKTRLAAGTRYGTDRQRSFWTLSSLFTVLTPSVLRAMVMA